MITLAAEWNKGKIKMAKFYGKIGFIKTEELYDGGEPTGRFKVRTIERNYSGDILRNNRRWSESTEKVTDDISIDNQFSILADSFMIENVSYLKYITYFGAKWKITNVDVQYPRLILTTGGVWNG